MNRPARRALGLFETARAALKKAGRTFTRLCLEASSNAGLGILADLAEAAAPSGGIGTDQTPLY